MITVRTSPGSPLRANVAVIGPRLYLDSCAVSDLAADSVRGPLVADLLLRAQGTLLYSWANLMELYSLGAGPTQDRLRAFLERFGCFIAVIEVLPDVVIEREKALPAGSPGVILDPDLVQQLMGQWDGTKPISLGLLVDLVQAIPGLEAHVRSLHQSHRRDIKSTMDEARARYRQAGARVVKRPPGDTQTEQVYDSLVLDCVTSNDAFTPSDAVDLWHTTVTLSYADAVVLDKKWARRARRLFRSCRATIFDVTQLDSVIDWLTGGVA